MARYHLLIHLSLILILGSAQGQAPNTLPNTQPLSWQGDLSTRMIEGIDRFLVDELERSVQTRARYWQHDPSSAQSYENSIKANRKRFAKLIGVDGDRLPVNALEFVDTISQPSLIAQTDHYSIHAVRWQVLNGVFGEGLLLQPKTDPVAHIIALPDADQTPEMITGLADGLPQDRQFARRLVENGCQVLVMTLIDRNITWSGNEELPRFTDQSHREWIYRQAHVLGRHPIGYEVQKVMGAVDWLKIKREKTLKPESPIGILGYAEGGLIAFYAAALDPRIEITLVSGYFDAREQIWREPIYRNIFGLLTEFGDAEIASLIAPRPLIIEHSLSPQIHIPTKLQPNQPRPGSDPWQTPDFNTADYEISRARTLLKSQARHVAFLHGNEGMTIGPCGTRALREFANYLGIEQALWTPPGPAPKDGRGVLFSSAQRQKQQLKQLVSYTQQILQDAERHRDQMFWQSIHAPSPTQWRVESRRHQSNLWGNVIGHFPPSQEPPTPRSRKTQDQATWTGYDVTLDLWPGVFAWGTLLLPKDLQPGQRRPVVVCQHDAGSLPADLIEQTAQPKLHSPQHGVAARLAELGFIVFAPHCPSPGSDKFRQLQRKASPLGKSIFSIVLAQHEQILHWLGEQPFVDPKRIGLYGFGYGGKIAMRIPALLDGYCLSICSGDFTDPIFRYAAVDSPDSYLYAGGGIFDPCEYNLAHSFSYAEMAALIAPRPFMVERRTRRILSASDLRADHEYQRARDFYVRLGIADRTETAVIGELGAFTFLHKHLEWPISKPSSLQSQVSRKPPAQLD